MAERRKLKRQHIMFYSRVFNRVTGEFIGYLRNLTPSRAMIISENELPVQEDYQLRIDLPEDIYKKSFLNLHARCVWCQRDVDPNFYNIGFEMKEVSAADEAIIAQINTDYGLPGGAADED